MMDCIHRSIACGACVFTSDEDENVPVDASGSRLIHVHHIPFELTREGQEMTYLEPMLLRIEKSLQVSMSAV